MWVYFQGILNSRLCIQGVVCKKRVMPRPLSGYFGHFRQFLAFFYPCQGNLVNISCFDYYSFFPLSVPSYLFWYRCSNATFLLITKLCQIWVVKYTNSLNAKLQKRVYIFYLAFLQGWLKYCEITAEMSFHLCSVFNNDLVTTMTKDYREPIKSKM